MIKIQQFLQNGDINVLMFEYAWLMLGVSRNINAILKLSIFNKRFSFPSPSDKRNEKA